MNKHTKQKGFVLVFVIAVVSALSIMTGAMFFYYDNDLKSVSRNSVLQQVNLAAETGLQEGQKWITDQLNSNSFTLVDIKNSLHIDNSDNKCLNRHGYTNSDKDIYYAKKYLQQKKFRVTITGKDYLFLRARKIGINAHKEEGTK